MDIFLTSVWGTARSVDLAVSAERAGCGAVWLAEHHRTPYGLCRDALALASSILDATTRLTVGTAAIPFWRWTPADLALKALALSCSPAAPALGAAASPGAVSGLAPGGDAPAVGAVGPAGVAGRFRLGVARGSRAEADCSERYYEAGFAPWLGELAELLGDGPPVMVAASSRETIELAASLGLSLLLGVENDDAAIAEKLSWWGSGGEHVRLVLPSTVDRSWLLAWQGHKLNDPAPYVDHIMSIQPTSAGPRMAVMVEASGQPAELCARKGDGT